ncbi:TetR/AcrR family transcriptional regulator [Kineococcus sp. SYSU DK005]|uniref:TetR/AcrR family transcriptional regulator n=1 Tax=Kineococcus sp. SYSU DK005 TaxID=3383126 RepID=UPI003D7CD27B
MADRKQAGERRTDALSRQRIVEAALEILDAHGESALTFRALAAHLQTGPGAIYHYVSNKSELLQAATEGLIRHVLEQAGRPGASPREAVREVTLAVFDALSEHPWVGGQLANEPWQSALLQIFEAVGAQLPALGVPEPEQFDAASTIVNYVLGVAGQYAAAARLAPTVSDRSSFLVEVAERWTDQHDVSEHPFIQRFAARLRDHDDREQFAAGIEILLRGLPREPQPQDSARG